MKKTLPLFLLFWAVIGQCSCTTYVNYVQNEETTLLQDRYLLFLFFSFSILVTAVVRHVLRAFKIPVPYPCITMLLGFVWDLLAESHYSSFVPDGTIVPSQMPWEYKILFNCKDLGNVESIYVPALVFTTGFCIDVHALVKSLAQILIISLPILLINTAGYGVLMTLVINSYNMTIVDGIRYGALGIAIFPRDVLIYLTDSSLRTKHVRTLIEGETILSAGIAICVFEFLNLNSLGWVVQWYQYLFGVLRLVVLAIPLGHMFDLLSVFLMKYSYNNIIHLMLLTVFTCYSSYFFSRWLLNAGCIGCMVAAVVLGMERNSLSKESEEQLLDLWKTVMEILNSVVFVYAGARLAESIGLGAGYLDFVLALVSYLLFNITRFLSFFLFSPILSRIGYGMTFKNLFICVWSGIKSPLSLFLLRDPLFNTIWKESGSLNKYLLFIVHTTVTLFLQLLINGSFVPFLFKALGLSEVSTSRLMNLNNCMKFIYEYRARTIAILKMDRFLSDANWPLVMNCTFLKHPYKKTDENIDYDKEEDPEEYFLGDRFTYCPDCQKNIPNEPTPKELNEMMKEGKMRILKLKKIIYSRQYEYGMVSKEGVRLLHQAVEIAMDSSNAVIELEGLYQLFCSESKIFTFLRNRMYSIAVAKEDAFKPPSKPWRLLCYRIEQHWGFRLTMAILILINLILLIVDASFYLKLQSIFVIIIYCFVYGIEFSIKVFAYSRKYLYNDGIKTYFSTFWNVFEFIIFCLFILVTIVFNINFSNQANKAKIYFWVIITLSVLLFVRLLRKLTYLKSTKCFKYVSGGLLKYFDEKVVQNRALAYELGKCYVTGEEEILENIAQIVDNQKIRDIIREKMEKDRLTLTKMLGEIEKQQPWVAARVNTKTVINSVLSSIKDDIGELRVSGWVDNVEYEKLLLSLNERYKYVSMLKNIQPLPPKQLFMETSYMGGEKELIEFLFSNVETKKYDPGDVVFSENQQVEGIYILITGMFFVSYAPKDAVLNSLKEHGILPVIDHIFSLTYSEQQSEYLLSGNSIGELATLTERPYNGTIVAETHSQVFVIKNSAIKKAVEDDKDPVNGFGCRLWKYIAFKRAILIMMNVPAYRSYTHEKLKYILERSFMPDLSNYKVFVVNEMMTDVLLIEGVVVDFNTRDMYIAPCCIPRAVQKLVLPKSSFVNIEMPDTETKLMVIPAKDFDEYEIMLSEEQTCELVNDNSSKCLQHIIQLKTSLIKNKSSSLRAMMSYSKHMKKKAMGVDSAKSRITYTSSKGSKASTKSSKVTMQLSKM